MSDEIKIITLGDIFKNIETEEKAFKFKDYITNLQTIEREYSSLLSENAELQQKYDKALSDLVKESHKRMELSKNYDRLNNIINQLKKYIGQEWYCFDNESIEFKVARDILDKLKELKENNRE